MQGKNRELETHRGGEKGSVPCNNHGTLPFKISSEVANRRLLGISYAFYLIFSHNPLNGVMDGKLTCRHTADSSKFLCHWVGTQSTRQEGDAVKKHFWYLSLQNISQLVNMVHSTVGLLDSEFETVPTVLNLYGDIRRGKTSLALVVI
jgi:hypothetical protein